MNLVCPHCFGDAGLKRRIEEIRPQFPNDKCTFHAQYKGVPIKDVAEIIDPVFRNHYGIAGSYSVPRIDSDRVDHVQSGDTLTEALYDLTEANLDDVLEVLAQQLIDDDPCWPPDGEEPFYADDQNYEHYDHYDHYKHDTLYHDQIWQHFCENITHKQRFFSSKSKELISELFASIHQQHDHKKKAVIYKINPGDQEAEFFRARITRQETDREEINNNPEKNLGAPPKRLRRAGRMNPAGISVFYGAYDLDTCIAELRPAVGDIVVGATFSLFRPIHVLDTTRFEAPIKPTSLFSKNHLVRVEQWKFMQRFKKEIAKPISPNDEHLDYIPTQAVAEYLLHHHEFKRDRKPANIEGIIFQSAQNPYGKNIVLLGDASIVKEEKNCQEAQYEETSADDETFFIFEAVEEETVEPALQIKKNSLQTKTINSVKYGSYGIDDLFDDKEL